MTEKINLTSYQSPIGALLVGCSTEGLVSLSHLPGSSAGRTPSKLVEAFARKHRVPKDRLTAEPSVQTEAVCAQLDDYFAGRLRQWSLPLDWQLVSGFRKSALQAAAEIPYGATRSYGELAAQAKSPRAARAVGSAMANNPISIVVPCHRVVRSGGELGNYGGGVKAKRWLLDLESQHSR